jgi:hypothetical protein
VTAPLVLVPLGPGEFIALEPDQLAQARERAREVLGSGWGGDSAAAPSGAPEPLLTGEQISEVTGIPAPWFLESARRREIPHVRLGRYPRPRFQRCRARGCDASGRGGGPVGPEACRGKGVVTAVSSSSWQAVTTPRGEV